MFFTKISLPGAAALIVILAGCERSSVDTTVPDPVVEDVVEATEVVMLNMEFSPSTVEIEKGTTIKWKNTDIVPHTATSAEFGDSGVITSGGTWRHTFTQVGEFPYECTLHPMMKGIVIVK